MAFGPCSPLAGLVVKHLVFLWSPGLSCPVPLCFSPESWAKLRFVTGSSRPPVPFTLRRHFLIFPGDLLAPGRGNTEPETASFLGGFPLFWWFSLPARPGAPACPPRWSGAATAPASLCQEKWGGEHGDLGEFGGFPGVFGGVWRFLGFSWSLGVLGAICWGFSGFSWRFWSCHGGSGGFEVCFGVLRSFWGVFWTVFEFMEYFRVFFALGVFYGDLGVLLGFGVFSWSLEEFCGVFWGLCGVFGVFLGFGGSLWSSLGVTRRFLGFLWGLGARFQSRKFLFPP